MVWAEFILVWTPLSTPLELSDPKRDVYIKGTVSTTDPAFSTQVPVTVHAVGSIGTAGVVTGFANADLLKTVLTVCLTFSGAHSVLNGKVIMNISPQPTDGGVCLDLTHTKPNENLAVIFGPGEYLAARSATIEWLNPIESVPSIVIVYWNFVEVNGVPQIMVPTSFSEDSITVEQHLTVQSEKESLKYSAMGALGTVTTIAEIVSWVAEKKHEDKQKTESKETKPKKAKTTRRPSRNRSKSQH